MRKESCEEGREELKGKSAKVVVAVPFECNSRNPRGSCTPLYLLLLSLERLYKSIIDCARPTRARAARAFYTNSNDRYPIWSPEHANWDSRQIINRRMAELPVPDFIPVPGPTE